MLSHKFSNILIIGTGGREFAFYKKIVEQNKSLIDNTLSNSNKLKVNIYNPSYYNQNLKESVDHYDYITKKYQLINIDKKEIKKDSYLIFIGSENYIAQGLVDKFENDGFFVLAPCSKAAKLETSKIYLRELIQSDDELKIFNPDYLYLKISSLEIHENKKIHNSSHKDVKKIEDDFKTNKYFRIFNNKKECIYAATTDALVHYKYLHNHVAYEDYINLFKKNYGGYVIKPDGLHSGKGVKVFGSQLTSEKQTLEYIYDILKTGESLLIEEKLVGKEFTLMSFCDKVQGFIHMPPYHDFKTAWENNTGPNTGSMGSQSIQPNKFTLQAELINEKVINLLNSKESEDNNKFKGVIYGSYMIAKYNKKNIKDIEDKTICHSDDKYEYKLKIIEFNVRFGDPEGILALHSLNDDLLNISWAIKNNYLKHYVENYKSKYKNKPFFNPTPIAVRYLVPHGYPKSPIKETQFWIDYESLSKKDLQKYFYYSSVGGDFNHQEFQKIENNSKLVLKTSKSRTLAILSNNNQHLNYLTNCIHGPLFHRKDINVISYNNNNNNNNNNTKSNKSKITYEMAGVSIDEGNKAVELMKESMSLEIGSFGGIINFSDEERMDFIKKKKNWFFQWMVLELNPHLCYLILIYLECQ